MKTSWMSFAAAILSLASGCQCCPLFDYYANAVDDVNDTHLYFDKVYNPRFDITRMGKADWCSPWNRHFCKRCCNNGCYDRYDSCNLYPPVTPYDFPTHVMPAPTYREQRRERELDEQMADELPTARSSAVPPAPATKETSGTGVNKKLQAEPPTPMP